MVGDTGEQKSAVVPRLDKPNPSRLEWGGASWSSTIPGDPWPLEASPQQLTPSRGQGCPPQGQHPGHPSQPHPGPWQLRVPAGACAVQMLPAGS